MDQIDKDTKTLSDDQKVIERFETDWESMESHWGRLHDLHRKDTKFTWLNNQWSDDAKADRAAKPAGNSATPLPPRPMNVYNISKPFIIKVINGVKKMRPQLKVNPVDDQTDSILADVHRGILKAIERNTGAVPSRMNALKDAVGSGYGFYGFDTGWENPKSFKQEIKYLTIEDATTVLWDDRSDEPDGFDLKKFISQVKYSKDDFKSEFGMDWDDVRDSGGSEISRAWGDADCPVISDYWYIEEKKEVLVSINGVGHYLKDVKKEIEKTGATWEEIVDYDEEKGEYIQRKTTSRQVYRCKLAGKKVLKKIKWPGYWIPRFKIDGRKTVCDGKTSLDGLTKDVRAPQTSYNYARNNKLERMSLTQKSGIFHAVGSIPPGEKHKYDTANTRNWARFGYNAYDKTGNPLPAPFRIQPVNLDPGAIQEEVTAAEEIKASLGMFGSYMGDTQGEKSGKAILAGAAESSDITFDFAYNLGLTMNHEGRVLSELIPKVYDTAQQVRMVGEDDKDKVIWVNKQAQDEKGQDYYYDMSKGKFDISVQIGKSNEDKRTETRLEMEALFGKMPELREISADIFVQTHEWNKADELGERYRRFIKQKYPGVIKDDDEQQQSPELIQAQQMMQQMQAQMQQVMQENEQLKNSHAIDAQKVQNDDMNNEEKNEIETYKADTDRMKVESDTQLQAAKIATEREKLRLEMQKAENDFKIEIARLNDARESRQQEIAKMDTESAQVETENADNKYSEMFNAINDKFESMKIEINNREQALPPINITNVIPEKKDAKITKDAAGNFNVN